MLRKPAAETFKVISLPSSGTKNVFVCILALNQRFVFLFEWETEFPLMALFPVISQILDMGFQINAVKKWSAKIGIFFKTAKHK